MHFKKVAVSQLSLAICESRRIAGVYEKCAKMGKSIPNSMQYRLKLILLSIAAAKTGYALL